jgi:hypothetical protein
MADTMSYETPCLLDMTIRDDDDMKTITHGAGFLAVKPWRGTTSHASCNTHTATLLIRLPLKKTASPDNIARTKYISAG